MAFHHQAFRPAVFLRDVKKASASNPDGSNTDVAGSGTGEDGAVIGAPTEPATTQAAGSASMILSSSVTDADSDMTRPHPMVAPVSSVLPAFETIVPRNAVVVPRVAALVTAQVMLPVYGPALPVSITSTPEALAVVSELPIRKVHDALSLPSASSRSVPVNCADDEKE
jgi:hypothetical protein